MPKLEESDPTAQSLKYVHDAGSVDPAFQVSGGLRLWRLAKMLYHTLSESQGSEGPTARPAGAPALELGAKGPATNPFPLRRAFKLLVAGQHGEAEAILLPLLHDDDPVHTSQAVRAQALLAALNWQLGRDREAEAFHRAVVAWQHQYRNPKTIRSYEILQDVLAERGLLLAAVQYPGRSAQPLTRLVEPGPDTLIVDNEQVFVEALKSRPIGEIYRDLFGGIFGHMTPYGNQLLAENVAAAILEWIERDPDRWN